VAAVSGAVTELFCRRVDDNFAVPVVVALAVGLVLQGGASWTI
jgi:dolichol kinase